MNYVKEYNKRLQTGKIEACEEIKSIYKRLVKEMDDDSSPFWFSEEQGEYVIGFIEGFCKCLKHCFNHMMIVGAG
mgnify:CR=1 FL=1